MAAAKVLISFLEGISSELGSLSVPYIQFVFCFNIEKRKLMSTLSTVRSVILDAEKPQEKSHTDKDWLEKLQVILYDAEDLVEELSLEVQQQVNDNRNMADKVIGFFSTLRFYIVMAFKMKTIRERLNEIAADKTKFHPVQQVIGLKDKNKETKQTYAFVPATTVIGRETDKRGIKQLLKKSSNEENVSIIPIIGIGGVGKTALAQLVYDDDEDDDRIHFDIKMWVWVSTVFDVETLVKKVIGAATKTECPNLEMDLLQHRLRENLDGKKYLLVLDDVWNSNRERWIELKNLLMGGARGSMILVTTRDRDVALIMGTVSPYELRGLSKVNCRALFEKLAFKPGQMECNPRLLAVGEEILEQCGGIPLAIRTVAGLLFVMETESEWLNVKNQLWELAQEDNHILPTLRVSYERLPSNLKKCFAYCSLFPKGSEIEKAKLIQLWMAQGFIQPSKNRLLEDIGDEYFKILWKRSFFQDEEMDAYGNVISCKMHNLMHDLAQTVAGFEYSIMNDDAVNISERVIHASVNVFIIKEITTSLVNARKLRTLLRTGRHRLTLIRDFDKFASTFKCLRALDFGAFLFPQSSDVLNPIGELKRLRYLDLSGNSIRTLPNSICELQNLQTLKLNYCKSLTELPRDIRKLVNLRHLENFGCDKLDGMPSGFGQLTSIQTLSLFVLGSTGGLSELEGLNDLRGELWIKNLDNVRIATAESREAYLKEKKYLQTLRLDWGWHEGYADEDVALWESLQPNPYLKGLHINGYGGVWFPSWLVNMGNSLPYLVEITLTSCSSCEYFPMFADQLRFLKVLKLSYLRSLEYIRSYISDSSSSSSHFEDNILSGAGRWFPALKEVYLFNLPKLKEWTREVVVVNDVGKVKTGVAAEQRKLLLSLNSLAKLTIETCPKLKSMPLHPDVQELKLVDFNGVLIHSMTVVATICPTTTTTFLSPSCFTLSKLRSLVIKFCDDLVSLPEGWLKNLTSIEYLEIEHCDKLESLSENTMQLTAPDMLQDLKCKELGFRNLHLLQLHYLPKLVSLPIGLQQATKLKELSIHYCDSLATSLDWMGNIRSLQSLDICGFKTLTSLPQGLQHLTALEKLDILNCPELNFSDEDRDMPGLRSFHSLQLFGLPKLASLPKVLLHSTALKNLEINQCTGLMTLPDWFGLLTSLQQLEISHCNLLKSLPEGMRCLTALQELTIWGCPYLLETCRKGTGKDWPKIAHIPNITIDWQRL